MKKKGCAIVWGISYFNHLLDGSCVEVLTDHIKIVEDCDGKWYNDSVTYESLR